MTGKKQVQSLMAHGARLGIVGDRVNSIPFPDGFLSHAIGWLKRNKAQAVTYYMVLPGVEDQMAIRVCVDGHVDTGSMETIEKIGGV